MALQTSSTIILFIFVILAQRTFVSAGRPYLEFEGDDTDKECPDTQKFDRRNANISEYMMQKYLGILHQYKMVCGGNRTSQTTHGPGAYLAKEVKGHLSSSRKEPDRCTYKIQAPKDYRVLVYKFSYGFKPSLYQCVDDSGKAVLADIVRFYDGKVEENSLLYSALHNPHDFNVTTTGRDLLIDIDQSGDRNTLRIEPVYHQYRFAYLFIKEENEKFWVYGETKPLDF